MSSHPARGRSDPLAHVLIIANRSYARMTLRAALPETISARTVGAAHETEGLFTKVVVVGGDYPLAELTEVRVHPNLFDKPVVLFAPGSPLPELDWPTLDVWPVTAQKNAGLELAWHVRRLMFDDGRGDRSPPRPDTLPRFSED